MNSSHISRKIDEFAMSNLKWGYKVSEIKSLYVLFHMWNLASNAHIHVDKYTCKYKITLELRTRKIYY